MEDRLMANYPSSPSPLLKSSPAQEFPRSPAPPLLCSPAPPLPPGRLHRGWKIAPPNIPAVVLKANTTPTGISIDWKKRKFKDTGVAFCTDKIAIALTEAATTTLIKRWGIVFIKQG